MVILPTSPGCLRPRSQAVDAYSNDEKRGFLFSLFSYFVVLFLFFQFFVRRVSGERERGMGI